MIFEFLEARLVAAGYQPGKTLFRDGFPATVERGIMLRDPLEGIAYDPEIPGWHKARIQMILRDSDKVAGAAAAISAMKALIVPGVEEGEGIRVSTVHPETLPIFFPRLEGGGFEWSVRFRAVFALT